MILRNIKKKKKKTNILIDINIIYTFKLNIKKNIYILIFKNNSNNIYTTYTKKRN